MSLSGLLCIPTVMKIGQVVQNLKWSTCRYKEFVVEKFSVITHRDLKHSWGKGISILLRYGRKKWDSMVLAGNVETKRRGADAFYARGRRASLSCC